MDRGLAIVLGGGGARTAYQAGVLRRIGRELPRLLPGVFVGESAGAINAAYLAAHPGSFREATEGLARLWGRLSADRVFRVAGHWLIRNAARWAMRLASGGWGGAPEARALLDATPLRSLLETSLGAVGGELAGIALNLERRRLRAVALTTIDYGTGETVTWVQGSDIEDWERPLRRGVQARLTVDHVMASAALPFLFPAVPLAGSWHGDGGLRLHAPLSPAVHLGANKVLAISTRTPPSARAAAPRAMAYPPPAQIAGVVLNAAFLDLMDQDALNLSRVNALLERLPSGQRRGLRPIDAVVLRPSRDLGELARECESCLPRGLRLMTRGVGAREAPSPDFLSVLMFEPGYLGRVIEIGEADAAARMGEIASLVQAAGEPAATQAVAAAAIA